jgi:tellurite resistance protein
LAKKSGGGAIGAVLLVGVGLLAAIPKEAWITIGVIAFAGWMLYLFFGSKGSSSSSSTHAPETRARPLESPRPSYAPPARPSRNPAPARFDDDEPVSMGRPTAPAPAQSFRVPDSPLPKGTAPWIPFGETVTVAGTPIAGGMLYVGASLPTLAGGDDPALINTKKSVANNGNYRERGFGYWPSYSEISASARRAYLNWLAEGRKAPAADIGYVFLYFYGLERRAILDAPKDAAAQADWPLIAAELKRLLSIYGSNGSFNGYATKLLSWVMLSTYSSKLYLEPLPDYERSWELPLHLRLVLGQCALDKHPVPATVALAWARLDPNRYLRTPAVRCPEQFEQLFVRKYVDAFGDGMLLPLSKTKLKFVYAPASSGFHGYNNINLSFGDVPDVTVLTSPLKKLQDLVEATTTELESYSRYVGRNPAESASLNALLLLPASLWPKAVQDRLAELKVKAERGMVVMKLSELLTALGASGTVTKDKLAALVRALETMHLGLEPDILSGAKAPKPDESVVLFEAAASEPANRAGASYQAAVLTLQLSMAVAAADGTIGPEELRQLRTQVEGWTHLSAAHQQRLRAHMRLLMDSPVSLTSLKKKLEPMEAKAKEAIAKFMAVIAQADGVVSPAEIKMLEKVYKVLGVDPKNVFTDVHAVAATGLPVSTTHAAVAPPQTSSTLAPGQKPGAFQLDTAKIAALQKDTEQVSALLANIFKDEEAPAPVVHEPLDEEHHVSAPVAVAGLVGLDEAHTSFVRLLLSRPTWSRAELEDTASDLELMLDGALERINEASFDAHDAPFTEGEDPITLNKEVLEKETA